MSEILAGPLHLHFLASWLMTGVIWTIQLVHYPLFVFIGKKEFVDYQYEHQGKITRLVAPLMLIEMGTAIALFWGDRGVPIAWLSVESSILVLTLLIWSVTFYLQVPLHTRLTQGKSRVLIGSLVRTNWIRTFLWTLKSLVVTVLVL